MAIRWIPPTNQLNAMSMAKMSTKELQIQRDMFGCGNQTTHIFFDESGCANVGGYISESDGLPIRLLDRSRSACSSDEFDKWIETAGKWIETTRAAIDRELIEKYMGLPGAKRLKDERKEVGRKWRGDNVSCFWRTLTEFTQTQLSLSAMSGSGERGELTDKERTGQSLLAEDLVVVKRDHSDGIFVDAAVVESGGATISVRTMSDTGNVVDVIIEDRVVAQAMEKKQNEFMTKKAERARLKKESAIKAQKKAAVDF